MYDSWEKIRMDLENDMIKLAQKIKEADSLVIREIYESEIREISRVLRIMSFLQINS